MTVRALVVFAFFLLGDSRAFADDDDDLVLYGEPHSYVDVVDAFDDDDPFDLNVSIGFERTMTSGTIQRERAGAADGRASQNFLDVADHSRVVNRLVPSLEIGLFHDLALYARLPVILSDDRDLSVPDGSSEAEVETRLQSNDADPMGVCGGAPCRLFDMPFTSPTRSGLDYLAVGLAWSIFNQHRDPEYPTWVMMAEGRFSIGEPMHACDNEGNCADGPNTDPGSSQGTIALRLETRSSWRHRYVEPYTGLSFQVDFPVGAGDLFEPGGALDGYLNTIPPIQGELTAGVAIIPWEQKARYQRFVLDLRLTGGYVSEGRSYSPLFDALGTSTAPSLTTPVAECAGCSRQTEFNGLTDMQSHGRIGGRIGVEMQAARYVRFQVNAGVAWESPYLLSFADACNPNIDGNGDDRMGTCRSGIINPHHRSSIDLPGNRFRLDGELTFDIGAAITGQF
jgi:hypothetical protein